MVLPSFYIVLLVHSANTAPALPLPHHSTEPTAPKLNLNSLKTQPRRRDLDDGLVIITIFVSVINNSTSDIGIILQLQESALCRTHHYLPAIRTSDRIVDTLATLYLALVNKYRVSEDHTGDSGGRARSGFLCRSTREVSDSVGKVVAKVSRHIRICI